MQKDMNQLLGKTLQELQAIAQEVGLPRFAGKQLAKWIYVRRASSFDEMTNISLKGPTPQFKSINSSALSFLYGPILTSIHDYWKNHGFD